jgi:hypothetical protein
LEEFLNSLTPYNTTREEDKGEGLDVHFLIRDFVMFLQSDPVIPFCKYVRVAARPRYVRGSKSHYDTFVACVTMILGSRPLITLELAGYLFGVIVKSCGKG